MKKEIKYPGLYQFLHGIPAIEDLDLSPFIPLSKEFVKWFNGGTGPYPDRSKYLSTEPVYEIY